MNSKVGYVIVGLVALLGGLIIGRAWFGDKPTPMAVETKQMAGADARLSPEKTPAPAAAEEMKAALRKKPKPQPVEKFHGPEMIAIPGKNYALSKYEVTQADWEAVMESNPSDHQGASYPVENVGWSDIQEYLKRLNKKTGKKYRLPKEAEWEYACHGDYKTECCGSNDINEVAWYGGNSSGNSHPVGQSHANGYGLYDMSGNVSEWMEDCWESDCAKHVLRGGAWINSPLNVRAISRNGSALPDRSIGFRLARTLP